MHRKAESLNFQSIVSVFNNNDRESVLFSGKCEIKELDGFLKCICVIFRHRSNSAKNYITIRTGVFTQHNCTTTISSWQGEKVIPT